ncbi:KICSTOR complex protein SZT2 [Copidosoma floridanum]|uniref:KICSTOR complex protein SZT2 n=1 Tax=Copidosoma floridanum TaxID=29053 RepID=UPI000C6F64F7|nr:KICSTOR complex protein SZT2 [Copidosoma floridanum]
MDAAEAEKPEVLEADTVYLLMQKDLPISRNSRAQWLLNHLETVIAIQDPNAALEDAPELEIVSVLPKKGFHSWSPETSYQYLYKVSSSTTIKFLAYKYKMVFSLDLGPSLATINVQNGEIVIDEVHIAMRRCLEGLTKSFVIPGSQRILYPEIYVTVIVHTPFFTNPAQQVLIQGWLVTAENVDTLMQAIENELDMLEEKVARVTSLVNLQLESRRAESTKLVGGLFEEGEPNVGISNVCNTVSAVAMMSPESSFVNMLRYGMLALSLLPEHSCSHLVILSDGIVGVNDIHVMESVIQQLRGTAISCSFLHVGSSYHPHSANGLVPYTDLLRFISLATLGSYMTTFPITDTEDQRINSYHENLLCWQLYRPDNLEVASPDPSAWYTKNTWFYGHEPPQLLRKKQVDDQVTCTLYSLLCCRLREGYLIKRATLREGSLEICFVLPWKTHVYVEYLVTCPRFTRSLSVCSTIQYTVTIEAPYDFLHDITCVSKKPLKSQYRQSMVSRFWSALTSLTESDGMLAHFSWFPGMGWPWYNVPDTIRSGMPVFYLPTSSSNSIQLSDAACQQFSQIWQPVVSLEPHQWSRWLHTQRVTLVLSHDRPLSKHLHQANQSGRFQSVQYRQAATVLYGMLKSWATFVLVENHTYVQFIHLEPDKPPISFSLISVSCKALCVVLNVAFAAGTDGEVRYNVMADLLERLSQLSLPSRKSGQTELPCCFILQKALEKILIRYERMPADLGTVVFPDGSQIIARNVSIAGGSPTTTLSRYLYHTRWLWLLKRPALQTVPPIGLPKLNVTSVARILSTITKIRLAEGFKFAYSSAGIINTVMEIQMKGPSSDENTYPCLLQYILFPPHRAVVPGSMMEKDSGSDEDTDDGELCYDNFPSSGDFQIVMEVWVEPQCGSVDPSTPRKASYMHSLQYNQLRDAIGKVDKECINALLTLEYLSLMCLESAVGASGGQKSHQQPSHVIVQPMNGGCIGPGKTPRRPIPPDPVETLLIDDRIRSTHFDFDVLGILTKFQQAELLFSMFADDENEDQLDNGNGSNGDPNGILMDGLLAHVRSLHNKELILSPAESDRFTEMLGSRPRPDGDPKLLFGQSCTRDSPDSVGQGNASANPRWRCFVKGISMTHVIVSLLPASEGDARLMAYPVDAERPSALSATPIPCASCPNDSVVEQRQPQPTTEAGGSRSDGNASPVQRPLAGYQERTLDLDYLRDALVFGTPCRASSSLSRPIEGSRQALVLPVYVYDCSLALLVDALVEKLERPRARDVHRDHTFQLAEHYAQREDYLRLKSGTGGGVGSKPPSPEPRSEDSDSLISDQRNLSNHLKVLNLAHCNAYVVAVYKSLVLQRPLAHGDMDAAVEQCEENLLEISITKYLRAVCRHLDASSTDESNPCECMGNMHKLIKDKFRKIISVAFRQVPVHPDFYYCLPSWKQEHLRESPQFSTNSDDNDDDDDDDDDNIRFSFNAAEPVNGKIIGSLKRNNNANSSVAAWSNSGGLYDRPKLSGSSDTIESFVSDTQTESERDRDQPLFLQLNCTVHDKQKFTTSAINVLPTCFTEIIQSQGSHDPKDTYSSDLKVTLDIICLHLPKEVLEVSIDHTPTGLRTTSYCSESSAQVASEADTETDNEAENDSKSKLERLDSTGIEQPMYHDISNLPEHQCRAVKSFIEEVKWLLVDETIAVLLDKPMPNEETLDTVAKHVATSNNRDSCYMDKVPLHFVFPSGNSLPRFIEELKKLTIDRYCIRQEGNLFYFVKRAGDSPRQTNKTSEKSADMSAFEDDNSAVFTSSNSSGLVMSSRTLRKRAASEPLASSYSENSSLGENHGVNDDGYEGDTSETDDEDEFQWLADLDRRRDNLPNFWLILRVEHDLVNVYFHCRFLELNSPKVDGYRQVQKDCVTQIKAICRRVNQGLLLRDLHDKRSCDPLLEPESSEDHKWKGNESGADASALLLNNHGTANVTPGMFCCPIVCEVPFCLHHRLKTGPGKTGLSRGIKALQTVLNRFSVNNRANMFVYQENNGNVFYLRLLERTYDDRPLHSNKLSESDEKLMVSRSNSAASLSQAKSLGVTSDQPSFATAEADPLRPRVRSFGERESDLLNKSGDLIVLMVHGVSEVGSEVRCQLVQVLQNRLDDAVLEVLSVMLARNPMCKLTPSDVHFIQRPYRAPENVIRLSVQQHCLRHMGALGYYLRQNILQFLYTPKYTDPRQDSHFQDYSQPEGSNKRVPERDIFLYNQSHSSGSRGIACIAVAIVNDRGDIIATENEELFGSMIPSCPGIRDFENIVASEVYWGENCEKKDAHLARAYIEFRIWKQGRVNLESLVQKLRAALKHANWDLITEYTFLPTVLAEPTGSDEEETNERSSGDPSELDCYELGEKGKLSKVYHTTLAYWFQFALDLSAPAIKKHVVKLERQHSLPVILKELQNLVQSHAPDTSVQTFVQWSRQPFVGTLDKDELLLGRSTEVTDGNIGWLEKAAELENTDDSVFFLPCDSTNDNTGTYIRSILIARNFNQWKASFSDKVNADQLMPKDQKLLQKFNPLISENSFVPRQRLLLAKVQSQYIVLYVYNWSKERSEKLIKQISNLGVWLSSRAIFHSNIMMQKLGIFHHQPARKYNEEDQSNSHCYQISDMESLAKFSTVAHTDKDWQRINNRASGGKGGIGLSWSQSMTQVMRDVKPSGQYPVNISDPVVKTIYDFQEVRHKDKKAKDDLNRLHTIWQSRGSIPNIPISQATMNTFKQHSRLIHYCHTPLLFLPAWRLQSTPWTVPPLHVQRLRTNSNTASKKYMTEWHNEICSNMLTEYKQYLQVLGFNPIQIESQKKKEKETPLNQIFYLIKTMLGGILMFEIHLAEPFLIVKLRAIECSRLQAKSNSALVNQFMLSFVDACDKIKINMHLHSFTYDFHLRCIHSYIASNNSAQWSVKRGYHLTNFLDDFIKYYHKAPNYARNLIYSGDVTVSNLMTPAQTLFQYLLSHEQAYGMQVLSMSDDTNNDRQRSEYVLVRMQNTPFVGQNDPQKQDTKSSNDFDVVLIVTRLDQYQQTDSRDITLKYYLMLTSKRELYPKREIENSNKIGKFRTVYSVVRSVTSSQLESPADSNPTSMTSSSSLAKSKSEQALFSPTTDSPPTLDQGFSELNASGEVEKCEADLMSPALAPTPPPVPEALLVVNNTSNPCSNRYAANLNQIREESINYLGYYAPHEQTKEQLMIAQASAAQQHIRNMVEQGALHCRTHLLWNRLLEKRLPPMTYAEFAELRSLACTESLSSLDSRLTPIVQQPISWYQGLVKVLQNKYQEYHKQFNAPDGNVTHHIILHPKYIQAFMMLTIDLHTSRGEIYAVYTKSEQSTGKSFTMGDVYSLIEDFVNACCFHLWLGLYS